MEFLPHTQEALDEYVSLAEPDLESLLVAMADAVERIVPECVALSLTLLAQDVTFTLVASGLQGEEIDSPQYSAGGPCEVALPEEVTHETSSPDLLDENRWALLARASAAAGVASSLTLPVEEQGSVIGSVNLYASSSRAFDGHHDELAAALGVSAAGAVTNADLDFESRRQADRAPQQLRDQQVIEVGVGILAAGEGLDIAAARATLQVAAARAGITEVQVAQTLITISTA